MATDLDQTVSIVPGSPHGDTLAWMDEQPGLLAGYEGQWVALVGRRVVAHDPSVIEVTRKAREQGVDDPLLVPIPPPGYIVG